MRHRDHRATAAMSKQPLPKQRRSQRGSVEDRWRKRVKDVDGNTLEVASAVAGKVTRWRARYVDNAGREHSRTFDRKVDAQKWLDAQLAALLRGDHIAPRDARLTVGDWCDKWLARSRSPLRWHSCWPGRSRWANGTHIVSDQWGDAGGPWTIERAARAARSGVGLPDGFQFHDLRHYFASLLIASGLDVKVVQARLRHASAKTTLDTYGHLWPGRDNTSRAAVAAVYRERP